LPTASAGGSNISLLLLLLLVLSEDTGSAQINSPLLLLFVVSTITVSTAGIWSKALAMLPLLPNCFASCSNT
jgi:hypothetical protein